MVVLDSDQVITGFALKTEDAKFFFFSSILERTWQAGWTLPNALLTVRRSVLGV